MSFHNPEYLLFLLLLIPVVFWYVWEMQRSDASLQISSQQRLKEYPKTLRLRLRHLPWKNILDVTTLGERIAHFASSLNEFLFTLVV